MQKNICIICQNVILYFLSASGDGGMADALDSGSSGSLSCEGSSPFLRTSDKNSWVIKSFFVIVTKQMHHICMTAFNDR